MTGVLVVALNVDNHVQQTQRSDDVERILSSERLENLGHVCVEEGVEFRSRWLGRRFTKIVARVPKHNAKLTLTNRPSRRTTAG